MTDTTGHDAERQRSEDDRDVAERLVEQARTEGLDLVGSDGVLTGLTKQVLETGLEAELTEHLGYDTRDPEGRDGDNSRNGTPPSKRGIHSVLVDTSTRPEPTRSSNVDPSPGRRGIRPKTESLKRGQKP